MRNFTGEDDTGDYGTNYFRNHSLCMNLMKDPVHGEGDDEVTCWDFTLKILTGKITGL